MKTLEFFENVQNILNIIKDSNLEIMYFNVSESKISIFLKNIISNEILENIHEKIFTIQ